MKWIGLIFIFFASCNKIKYPLDIERLIKKAGSNKSEIEKVIEHYSVANSDSLKLRATYFLLRGMEDMYYYEGELLERYQSYPTLILRDKENGEYIEQSLKTLYGPFDKGRLKKTYDLQAITAEQMQQNIDMAFKVWKEQPWGRNISFNQFCEFILPFRIGDEIPAYNRKEIYEQFNPLLDSIRKAKGDAVDACKVINNKLIKDKWLFTTRMSYLPHFPAKTLIKYRVGSCQDMADLACYVMRAVGIPVANEFLPQWPMRSDKHNWNSVLTREGKWIVFLGAEDSPGTPHKMGNKRGKIFRHTYLKNQESLAAIVGNEVLVPGFLQNPRLKDVTDEYVSCYDVILPLTAKTGQRFAYINVFNDESWVPIQWGKIQNGVATFRKMENGILYNAICVGRDGEIKSLGDPFILDNMGKVKHVTPDVINTTTMVLKEKSPILADWYWVKQSQGGRFQGANKRDFSDAVTLHTIIEKPKPFVNTVTVSLNKPFRYVRYQSAPGMYCIIGSIAYYSSSQKLKGTFISKKGVFTPFEINHNEATRKLMPGFHGSQFSCSGWVGLDLGEPKNITKMEYTTKVSPDNNPTFVDKHKYTLSFWNNDDWKLIGDETVIKGKLTFFNVPQHGLYKLANITQEDEVKRIFTYENGKQIWW